MDTDVVMKFSEQGQWLWDNDIKFARWQHSAVERNARFAVTSITFYLVIDCIRPIDNWHIPPPANDTKFGEHKD